MPPIFTTRFMRTSMPSLGAATAGRGGDVIVPKQVLVWLTCAECTSSATPTEQTSLAPIEPARACRPLVNELLLEGEGSVVGVLERGWTLPTDRRVEPSIVVPLDPSGGGVLDVGTVR